MGKGDPKDRKPHQASSSAQAAQFLTSRNAGAVGAGFGGFSGSTPAAVPGFAFGASAAARLAKSGSTTSLASGQSGSGAEGSAATATGANGEAQLSSQLDGEIAQCLRHMSKKDAVTKLKALQALRALIKGKSASDVVTALPPWVYLYQRLSVDASRHVRTEAAATSGELVGVVGKAVAPHLKSLMGPWWLAQFDPHTDAAVAARTAFQACFPGRKQYEALLFCCNDLLAFINDQATANAQQLGDARKDTPEEMEERYERVVSAALLSLGTLLQILSSAGSSTPGSTETGKEGTTGDGASTPSKGVADNGAVSSSPAAGKQPPAQLSQVWNQVATLVNRQGYVKSCFGSKSILIRAAVYALLREVCSCLLTVRSSPASTQAQEGVLHAAGSSEVASAVLGVFNDKEAGNHAAMWAMVLIYIKVFPDCWASINVRKMFLPRLTAFLRHGCFGSDAVSWPALLPLMSLMPHSVISHTHEVAVQLLEATWTGVLDASSYRTGRAAAVGAYQECLQWLLTVAAQHAGGSDSGTATETSANTYREQLLHGTLLHQPLNAALAGGVATGNIGLEVVVGSVKRLSDAAAKAAVGGPAAVTLQVTQSALARSVAAAVSTSLSSPTPTHVETVCSACEQLVLSLRDCAPESAEMVAKAVVGCLVDSMQAGGTAAAAATQLPPAASQLLASLIRSFGSSISTTVTQQPATATAATGNGNQTAATTFTPAAGQLGGLDLEQLVMACLAAPADSPAAAAQAHLLVSWLLTRTHAQQDWTKAISQLSGITTAALQEPTTAAAHLEDIITGLQDPGLRVVQLLCSCLLESLTTRSSDSAADHPWHQALGGLLQLLASETALGHVAAGVVLPVGPGGAYAAEDLSRAAADLSQDPIITLLSFLLGANEASMLLVTQQQAVQALDVLQDLLVDVSCIPAAGASSQPAVPTAVCYTDVPGLLTLKQLSGAGCAALAVSTSLMTFPTRSSKQAARATIWQAAPGPMVSLLGGIIQLAWCQQAATQQQPTYVPNLDAAAQQGQDNDGDVSDGEAADLFDGEDGSLEDSFVSLNLSAVQEADSWLTLAMHMCSAAWAAQAARMLLGPVVQQQQQQQQQEDVSSSTVQQLCDQLGYAVVTGLQQQARLARSKAGSASQSRAAAAAAARIQQVLRDLPATATSAQNQFIHAVLHQALGALEQALKGSKGPASGSSRTAQYGGLNSEVLLLVLLLAHVAHAVGAQRLLAAAGKGSTGSQGRASSFARTVGALLCAEAAIQQAQTGGPVLTVVRTAVRALLHALAAETETGTMGEVMQTLYIGACMPHTADSTALLQFTDLLYAVALQAFLKHLSKSATGSSGHMEHFCAVHLLPATPAAAAPQLSPSVLQSVLSIVATSLRGNSAGLNNSSLPQVSINLMNQSLACPAVTLEPTRESVDMLQLANACFPVPSRALHGVTSSATQSTALQATSSEEQLLVKLLKHQVVRQGAVAAARRTAPSGSQMPYPDDLHPHSWGAAKLAAARLELAAAAFCGPQLHAAEWHTLLSHVQASLSAAVQLLRSMVDQLCTGIKACGESLLGSAGASTGMTGAVALQLLRQLRKRGVLTQHPAYEELVTNIADVLSSTQLDAELQPAVQAVLVLLRHLQYCSTRRADQLPEGLLILLQKYRQEVGDACNQLLQLVLLGGIAHSLGVAGGAGPASAMAGWLSEPHSTIWATAGAATCSFLDLSVKPGAGGLTAAAYTALTETDKWLATHDMALHTVDAMLSLALAPSSSHGEEHQQRYRLLLLPQPLVEAAYISLLHAPESVTCRLALPMESESGELPDFDQGTDPCTYLMHAGLHPLLAAIIGAPADKVAVTTLFTAWAILLAHLSTASAISSPGTQSAPNTVRQALGEVAHLAPDLLQQLLPYLALQDYAPGRSNAARKATSATAAATGGASTGTQGAASAALGVEDLRGALRQVGLPCDSSSQAEAEPQDSLAAVAKLLYAGVLHVLPASARTWFSDLRDRNTALAVEAYTAAQISPALLAAEMQDVQARGDALRGEQFAVRGNITNREVTAVLTVEEGSSIELAIKLPPALPLKPPEVECRKKLGVSDARMRKWLLSISGFLRSNNRGLADAISMWRTNVESEFAGMEACLICYSVVAATNSALPRLQCHTCQVRFHPGCLYKWFKSSGKSACPHCQSPW